MNSYVYRCKLAVAIAAALLGTTLPAGSATLATPQAAMPHMSASVQTGDLSHVSPYTRSLYIVILDPPAVAAYRGEIAGLAAPERTAANKGSRLKADAPASRAYENHLLELQENFESRLATRLGHEITTHARFQHALNAVVLSLSPQDAAIVAREPGVRLIEGYREYPLDTDLGPALIGAPPLVTPENIFLSNFEEGETQTSQRPVSSGGEGIVIGVLDTGINFDSPSFSATSADGYQHTNPLGTGTFQGLCAPGGVDAGSCNDKLFGAYDFVFSVICPGGVCPAGIVDEASAEDNDSHGTHTASTAGGNARIATVTGAATRISGVAPRSSIVAFDTCYRTATSGLCPNVSNVGAVNQAIADGQVDVINFSIGGGAAPWSDAVSLAFLNAADAGIFVAASAGNSGPNPSTTSHAEPWTTTVGASTHARNWYETSISVSGGVVPLPTGITRASPAGSGNAAAITAAPLLVSPGFATANDGCAPFPAGTFTGRWAVILRGTCAFSVKAVNAQAAGALGVVLANNQGGTAQFTVGLTPPAALVPVFSVSQTYGTTLTNYVQANPAATMDIAFPAGIVSQPADVMAAFSSRGPAQFDVIKPDVTAPGVGILAAVAGIGAGQGVNLGLISGTSMSGPHTAGAAALLRKLYPSATPLEIKSMLMLSGRTQGVFKQNGTTPSDPFDRGGGRLQVDQAAKVGLTLNETGLRMFNANPGATPAGQPSTLNLASLANGNCVGTCSFTRRVKNVLGASETWTLALGGVTGTVTPTALTLAPGAEGTFTVNVNPSALTIGTYGFGEVSLTPAGTSAALRMPVAVRRSEQEIDLAPTSFALSLATNMTTTRTLNIRNLGGAALTWTIPSIGTGNVALVSQVGNNSNGFLSSFFAGNPPGRGAYTSDDFVTQTDATASLLSLPGFVLGAASLTAAAPTGVTFKIYSNIGIPAGNPEAGVGGEVYSCTRTLTGPNAVGFSIPEGAQQFQTLRLDLAAAAAAGCPAAPVLAPGSYWAVAYPSFTGASTGPRWFNFVSLQVTNNTGQTISPSGLAGSPTWTSVAPSGFDGFALTARGTVDCALPTWLVPAPTAGSTAPGTQTPVTLTIDTAGLAPGVYRANVCVNSNDTDEATVAAPVVLTVP